jgi:NAD(P)-dependent dehydrogenase (short-subunit alcohol dehydrogenase family)
LPLAEEELDDGRLEGQMAVNAYGPIRMIQQFLPLMKEDGLKRLTTISSEAGSIGECWRDSEISYCMSKGALNRGLQIIHHHLSPRGFQMLALHPGWLRTDMGGPTATDDPLDAARNVFKLTMQERDAEAPFYLNFDGRPIAW